MVKGLYSLDEFKDNCGFGLIAHTKGQASHRLLKKAIESLTNMTHRGGIAADGKTGDGCGLLLQKPDGFFRQVLQTQYGVELAKSYAVGSVMLDQDKDSAVKSQEVFDRCMAQESLPVTVWRDVPINKESLGPIALSSLPQFKQVFINQPETLSDAEFLAKLLIARRNARKQVQGDDLFYVASLGPRTVSYKGLMMPADLPVVFPDLANPELQTAICVFHQRFSTNTMPRWPLAQPFRMLAHNGEINTIQGNRNWATARISKFVCDLLPNPEILAPMVNRSGSDSSSLDNMLELLQVGGMELHRAIRLLVPPAWQNAKLFDDDLRAFYEFNSMHIEPWDGPAGLVVTDGRYAVCTLDRNGLRPSRWVMTKDDIITVASEIGVNDCKPEDVVAKGRLGPGQILSVDTKEGTLSHTADIDHQLKSSKPYKQWLKENAQLMKVDETGLDETKVDVLPSELLDTYMKHFQVSLEECTQVLKPLVELGQEAIGSMGDDTPLAVLSRQQRPLYDYFRQQFAQVTNPPIDPLRETVVMSLETCMGRELSVYSETPEHANRLILKTPVLSPAVFTALTGESARYPVRELNLVYNPEQESLASALARLVDASIAAVRSGTVLLVLTDKAIAEGLLPAHALLAMGAIHHRLIEEGLRCDVNLIVATASARDPHHIAVLIGFGATAVYPYLSYSVINNMLAKGELSMDPVQAYAGYNKGINKGLLKILSKMGISTIASYRGAQLFEAVGLDDSVIKLCFPGVPSRIQGATFTDLEDDQRQLARLAWKKRKPLSAGGIYKYVHGEEYHAFNPDVIQGMHKAVRTGDFADWMSVATLINQRPITALRDLLKIGDKLPAVPLNEVEPVANIVKRFDSAGMSLGALSPEAHEALAEAQNRLGGRSNSGEGGEDPARYGTVRMSKIKQISSGRFGVTPHYLVNAEVLQIKIAQGAKPGEGGQLPGGKVNELIARLRYSAPGVTLISPPPHHDIYSIEDLAQLIYDLKQVNPQALVSVKLVSRPGVGTIAAGVVKAYADFITISGYDGGTAASPLTSIRYAGSPWELGLSETHQVLCANDLRGKVRVQADGGLKTGLDVVKAAMLGAESFGFGTGPMVMLGCKYLRICHLNNCATGVATQREDLRNEHYRGTVEMAMNFFRFVAEETRHWMARLGVRTLNELIGRVDLLQRIDGETPKHRRINLDRIIYSDELLKSKSHYCQVERNTPYDRGETAEQMVADILPAIEQQCGGEFHYTINNRDRSIGARLSGEIAKRYGNQGMKDKPIHIYFKGIAGQSFGVWNAGGLHLYLEGDANDYVGKGMAGGKIVIRPAKGCQYKTEETSIIGNTCLYGATGGQLFAAGRAGERCGVRNSGAQVVVEGAGDHCCEYMTRGQVTVLGETGVNFGAGMTGGFAYVLDRDGQFAQRYNPEYIDLHRLGATELAPHTDYLHGIVTEFVAETQSEWGQYLLDNFSVVASQFILVKPKSSDINQLL